MRLLLAVVKPQAAASKEVNSVARPRNTAGGQERFRGVPRIYGKVFIFKGLGYRESPRGGVETEARSVQGVF